YLAPVGSPSSLDGLSLGHASLHHSYRGSAVPNYPPHWLQRRNQSRGGSFLVMLRPARWLERLANPRRRLCAADRPARLRQSLPPPGSAITTRPNHPLPRQDLHLQACQRPKAAHRNLVFGAPACTQRCAGDAGPEGAIVTEVANVHTGPGVRHLDPAINKNFL